jgi:hypothetical protein
MAAAVSQSAAITKPVPAIDLVTGILKETWTLLQQCCAPGELAFALLVESPGHNLYSLQRH